MGEDRAPYHLTGHYCKLVKVCSAQFSTERLHNRRKSHLTNQGDGLCHSQVPGGWCNIMKFQGLFQKKKDLPKSFMCDTSLPTTRTETAQWKGQGLGPGFAVPQCGSISSWSPFNSANAKEGFCCCNDCQIADLLKTCWTAWRQRTFLYCWQCWACS